MSSVTTDAPAPGPDGLCAVEVERRRARAGWNEIAERPPRPLVNFLRTLWGAVPWTIEATLVLELVLSQWAEAGILAGLLVLNSTLQTVQQGRARAAVDLLRAKLQVVARVRRDGAWHLCPARELVPGDRVHVRMGDIVPADARVESGSLEIDQSMLTGESTSVTPGVGATVYSGSIVRRGEADVIVTAIGSATFFGRTADLVRTAHAHGHLEDLVFTIVQYLLAIDAAMIVLFLGDGFLRHTPLLTVIPFVLILLIASVPLALLPTFTVASAYESTDLSRRGVLVTELSAVEDAAGMDTLCSDKTGTLTENRQRVVGTAPLPTFGEAELLSWASAACDPSTQDPIDLAILAAAAERNVPPLERTQLLPFDPANKRSEARVRHGSEEWRVVLGQPATVAALTPEPWTAAEEGWVENEGAQGHRILSVAIGPERALHRIGLIAMEDPVREDAPALVARLNEMGIQVVMVTGDAVATARSIARELGLSGRVETREGLGRPPEGIAGFAQVFPEDKLAIVRGFQASSRIVGMTGDGVNDAPALRQAEVGIAVANATDVARASAKLVITEPGLGGIVAAVESGRRFYRRMLTWTLNKTAKTFEQVVLLAVSFVALGVFVTTPFLILLMIFANDFVTMTVGADRVRISSGPDRWNVRRLMTVAAGVGAGWLILLFAWVVIPLDVAHWSLPTVQTLIFLALVFSGQATLYLVRERGPFYGSRPSTYLLIASTADILLLSLLAVFGVGMAPVSGWVIVVLLATVVLAAVAIDRLKLLLFSATALFRDAAPEVFPPR